MSWGNLVGSIEEQQQLEKPPKKEFNLFSFVLLLLGPALVLAIVALLWWWITCEEGGDCWRVVLGLTLLATAFVSFLAVIYGVLRFLRSFRASAENARGERRSGIAMMVISSTVLVISAYVLFILLLTGIGDDSAEELSLIASHILTD